MGGSAITTVYAVFADRAEAERIGRDMVERRLAACVNILGPCTSFYRWEGRVERAEEVPALFKTREDMGDALVAAVAEAHGYDVPAVARWPEQATAAYAAWVAASIG